MTVEPLPDEDEPSLDEAARTVASDLVGNWWAAHVRDGAGRPSDAARADLVERFGAVLVAWFLAAASTDAGPAS